jgi:hypothetical protein
MKSNRLPDFIIAGAMKSGTTTLHHVLAEHPGIYIPRRERFFFNIDDLQQVPALFAYQGGKWWMKDFEANLETYLSWYASFFEDARDDQLVGEDTTSYLVSRKAPERIATLIPDVKIIIILRDPASRCYSHYWHSVRTGRAMFSFEDTIRVMQGNIIERSHYKEQVERFLHYFPSENVLFLLFEEMVKDIKAVTEEICHFLGVEMEIDMDSINLHHNPAKIPRNLTLQLWRNRLLYRLVLYKDWKRFPDMPETNKFSRYTLETAPMKLLDRLHRLINRARPVKPKPMLPQTRQFLNNYFERVNKGLPELIGKDVERFWYKD